MGGMTEPHERTFAPAAPLRPWVTDVHVMSVSPEPRRAMTRLPNGSSSLVLCTAGYRGERVLAVGPNLRASYKAAATVPLYTRFTFQPGSARAFFGVALHELAGHAVSLDDLWGPRAVRLRGELARANGAIDATLHAIERALLEQLDARGMDRARATLAGRAVRALDAGIAEPEPIPALARRLGVSERQLRQVFHEEIGVSPKRYARIARVRRAVAGAGRTGWAQLASETGFYDQAHLNAEFRDLLGVTPRAFLAGDVPLHVGC
jgi:AraC-like DNA-binding protein